MESKRKEYKAPSMEVVQLEESDIVTASSGKNNNVETPEYSFDIS